MYQQRSHHENCLMGEHGADTQQSEANLSRSMRATQIPPRSTLIDPATQSLTSGPHRILEILRSEWQSRGFSSEKARNPPDWNKFAETYAQYLPPIPRAPAEPPDGQQLYQSAQKIKYASAAGEDGFRPAELRSLPLAAWGYRAVLLKTCSKVGRFPHAYRRPVARPP